MPKDTPEVRLAILETKQDSADEWRTKTDDTLAEIAKALQMLARIDMQNEGLTKQVLELRQEQRDTFSVLTKQAEDHGKRLAAVELAMPPLTSAESDRTSALKSIGKLVLAAFVGAILLHFFGIKVPGA